MILFNHFYAVCWMFDSGLCNPSHPSFHKQVPGSWSQRRKGSQSHHSIVCRQVMENMGTDTIPHMSLSDMKQVKETTGTNTISHVYLDATTGQPLPSCIQASVNSSWCETELWVSHSQNFLSLTSYMLCLNFKIFPTTLFQNISKTPFFHVLLYRLSHNSPCAVYDS